MNTREQLPAKNQIAERAYEIFLERGGQDGRDIEDWLAAEAELSENLFSMGRHTRTAVAGQEFQSTKVAHISPQR